MKRREQRKGERAEESGESVDEDMRERGKKERGKEKVNKKQAKGKKGIDRERQLSVRE